jgi:hypothetical protein
VNLLRDKQGPEEYYCQNTNKRGEQNHEQYAVPFERSDRREKPGQDQDQLNECERREKYENEDVDVSNLV